MLLRKLLTCFFISIIYLPTFSQKNLSKKEADFVKACQDVVNAVYKKDVKKLNSYVHPQYGLYFYYHPGVMDIYENRKKINIYNSEDSGYAENKILSDFISGNELKKPDFIKSPLQYGKLPWWNCEDIHHPPSWNKIGFFADTIKKYNPLSEIAQYKIKYGEKISSKELNTIKFIESKSHKVIFANNKENGIIFYMAYINNKWYLTILDLSTMDCSA